VEVQVSHPHSQIRPLRGPTVAQTSMNKEPPSAYLDTNVVSAIHRSDIPAAEVAALDALLIRRKDGVVSFTTSPVTREEIHGAGGRTGCPSASSTQARTLQSGRQRRQIIVARPPGVAMKDELNVTSPGSGQMKQANPVTVIWDLGYEPAGYWN
jgi:hypothetical protein